MTQFRLDEDKTSIVVLLAVLAMSSLGFAILSLVLGPELQVALEQRPEVEVQIARPQVPELNELAEFWEESGYTVLKRNQDYGLQRSASLDREVWIQGRETLVLVPLRYEAKLSSLVMQLSASFLEAGWMIQLEATDHGYSIGFWSSVPGWDHKVLAYLWDIELLNPQNYDYHYGGFIPVMGQLFDPEGFRRGTPEAPVLALIIDDWGYDTPAANPMIAYPFPLTMAVLPHLGASRELSERIHRAGHEVILHQPMEALDASLELGPGGITLGMDRAEVEARLRKNAASLPMAVGVSNHMGSSITADYGTMTHVIEVMKELGLFFVDSRTTTASVAAEVAGELGVPYGVNGFFIDNESDVDKTKTQVRLGLALAQKQGHAVMIGHVRPTTVIALWELIPEFLDSGVRLVSISELLHED